MKYMIAGFHFLCLTHVMRQHLILFMSMSTIRQVPRLLLEVGWGLVKNVSLLAAELAFQCH